MKLREIQINKEVLSTIELEREEIKKFQLEVNHLAYKFGYIVENKDIETDNLQKININLVANQPEHDIVEFLDHTKINPVAIVKIGFNFDKFWNKSTLEKQIYIFETIDFALKHVFQKMNIPLRYLKDILETLSREKTIDFTYQILNEVKGDKQAYIKYIYDKSTFDAFVVIEDNNKQVLIKKIDSPKHLYDFFYKLGKITWIDNNSIKLLYDKKEKIYSIK